MHTKRISLVLTLTTICVLLSASNLLAVPTQVSHSDDPTHCDPLFIPQQVDEIGDLAVFPFGEELEAVPVSQPGPTVCLPDDPNTTNAVVDITNLTTKTFEEVWYVANSSTDISNFDGFANDLLFPGGHEAFRIDVVGVHRPLLVEIGGLPNFKWDPGETWRFVLQDYFNALGLSPAAIDSIGVGDASTATGVITSTGSIIARVPEPATCMLMMLGLAGMLVRPWKRDL